MRLASHGLATPGLHKTDTSLLCMLGCFLSSNDSRSISHTASGIFVSFVLADCGAAGSNLRFMSVNGDM